MSPRRKRPDGGSVALTLNGAVKRSEIPALCERLRAELRDGDVKHTVLCDVGGLAVTDMVAVEALTRMQLTARRLGSRMLLRGTSAELQSLLSLLGLQEILPSEPERSGQARRQAEEREQPRSIEEKGHAADPPTV